MIDWKFSAPVPVLPPLPPRERSVTPPSKDLERVRSALFAIPNTGDAVLPREEWLKVVYAVHYETGGDPDALEWVHEWSERAGDHDREACERDVWDRATDDRGDANVVTGRYLFMLARNRGEWQDPADADAFEVLPEAPQPAPAKPTGRTLGFGAFTRRKRGKWLIRGVLPDADLIVLYGESGSGKSFLALDMAMHIEVGKPWQGRKTRKARCFLLVAEGQDGAAKRALAAAAAHGRDPDEVDIVVLPVPANLMERDEVDALIADINASGPAALVIVDTLARSMVGGDENSAQDMGKVVANCSRIRKATGAAVMLVHHSGKDTSKGARGSNSLRAAADAELEVSRTGDIRLLTITKQKDGEDGLRFGYRLEVVPVGVDDDGEEETSCAVRYVDAGIAMKAASAKPQGPNEAHVLATWQTLLGLDPADPPGVEQVIAAAVDQLPAPDEGKKDTRRQVLQRALGTLAKRGALRIAGGKVVEVEG